MILLRKCIKQTKSLFLWERETMNVAQLLERVRLEIHNDLTDEQIIGRFNEQSRLLYRKLKFPEKIYAFMTGSVPYYILPEDCSEDGIRCVAIDGIDYIKVNPNSTEKPYFCMVVLEKLFISPHDAGKEAYLYYKARPQDVTELTDVPNIPEDYHSLYIYDACQWIAGIQRDTDMKNNFYSEYSSILNDAEKYLRKMGLQTVKITTNW